MRRLTFSDAAFADLLAACEEAFPIEACGLLIGVDGADASRHVTAIVSGRNLDASPDRFLLDPSAFLRADAIACERGLELVGSFHSHPGHPAIPSRADEAAAQ